MRTETQREKEELIPALLTETQWGEGGLFPKEIGEMRHFFKSKTVGDLRNAPVGLSQQDLGLTDDARRDELAGRFAGIFF